MSGLKATMFLALLFSFLVVSVQFAHGKESAEASPKSVRGLSKHDLDMLREMNIQTKREACEDVVSSCSVYASYCDHESYKEYLKENCKKTCSFCETCVDRLDCSLYKEYGYCEMTDFIESMKYYCPLSCGYCDAAATTAPPTTLPRTEKPIDQGMECGKKAAGARIVGGTQAAPGAWPWQVTLDYIGQHQPHWCGGTIVTPQWIVTAAHCFAYTDDPKQYTIVAGQHDLNTASGFEQDITIEKIIKHQQYAAHKNHDYDIALVKLQSPLMFNTRVRPACLAKFDFDDGTNCYVTGWGHTAEGGDIPQILHQAQVPLISRQVCQSGYGDLGHISARMRCAGYAEGGIDACQGDSGGPLVCSKDNKWYLMGAVSWGIGCARKGRYGVYADLMDLKYWVQGTISSE